MSLQNTSEHTISAPSIPPYKGYPPKNASKKAKNLLFAPFFDGGTPFLLARKGSVSPTLTSKKGQFPPFYSTPKNRVLQPQLRIIFTLICNPSLQPHLQPQSCFLPHPPFQSFCLITPSHHRLFTVHTTLPLPPGYCLYFIPATPHSPVEKGMSQFPST